MAYSLNDYFARASDLQRGKQVSQEVYDTLKSQDGVYKFKRKILGRFGRKRVVSIDEIAFVLNEVHIAESLEEGRRLATDFCDHEFFYITMMSARYLGFNRVDDRHIEIYSRNMRV